MISPAAIKCDACKLASLDSRHRVNVCGCLPHGLYRLHWRDDDRTSLAAVGSDAAGHRWFAATNWLTVPSFDWTPVDRVERIA